MATTTIIPLHATKGRSAAAVLSDTADYMKNPEKTNREEWVTAYECDPLTVAQEFAFARSQYAATTGKSQGANEVVGYHLRQSFAPGETDAATANRIGYDLAMSLTKGKFAYICCTHTDKNHIHNHILLSAVNLDCSRKFRHFKNSAFALRKISDLLCVQNGLSIIENPKDSRGSYADWLGKKPPTAKEQLCELIDEKLIVGQDMGALLVALKKAGCEVKIGKHTAIKIPGGKKFQRFDTIGGDYSEDALRERLNGKREVAPRAKVTEPQKSVYVPKLLIDIEAKIQQGYGAGFEQYAKIQNLKEAAKTLIFLQENGIGTYEELVKKESATSGDYGRSNERRKEIDSQLAAITELQKQIGIYSKTRATLKEYNSIRKPKDRQKFYNTNSANIILCQAAKRYFDEQSYGKDNKLPSIEALKREYATLLSEKRTLGNIKEKRETMIKWAMVKNNVDRIFAEPAAPHRTHERGAR
jgi:hypothetical protein